VCVCVCVDWGVLCVPLCCVCLLSPFLFCFPRGGWWGGGMRVLVGVRNPRVVMHRHVSVVVHKGTNMRKVIITYDQILTKKYP